MGLPAPSSTTTTPRRMRESTILLEEIGRGGGGTVHKAMHVPSMRLVAVKMMEVHDDKKRSQMIVELKALLSMNRVRERRGSTVILRQMGPALYGQRQELLLSNRTLTRPFDTTKNRAEHSS